MKKSNHRGTENTEGLHALSLLNLEAIRDDLIELMTKKLRAFALKMRLEELGMTRLLSKKDVLLNGSSYRALLMHLIEPRDRQNFLKSHLNRFDPHGSPL